MLRALEFTLLVSAVAAWPSKFEIRSNTSACAKWCAQTFPNPGRDCTSLAAHGAGPCYICGPLKNSSTETLCGLECAETSSDSQNCGKCGNVCPSGTTCNSGACVCPSTGQPPCNGICLDYNSDNNNCGSCGNKCPPRGLCLNGRCQCPRYGKPAFADPCNGTCPDFVTDPMNCGFCGNQCPAGSHCFNLRCFCNNSNMEPCNGTCPDPATFIDDWNCGYCHNVCLFGTTCNAPLGLCGYWNN